MSLASTLSGFVSVGDISRRPGNQVRALWDRLSSLPGGKQLFSHALGRMAPYSGTIKARITELRDGFARVEMADRRAVRNHLNCLHAIALCNLAEITGNIAVAYTLPDDMRFIVSGLSIDYLKKARGLITGTCECPVPRDAQAREYDVPVELRDAGGEVVVRAVLKTLVGYKPTGRS
ncbi:MAG: hotdog fold domain-containing protein [Nannocystaceae bacterium]